MEEWLACDIFQLDLLVIQIDGLHVAEDIVLIGAIGIDGNLHLPVLRRALVEHQSRCLQMNR